MIRKYLISLVFIGIFIFAPNKLKAQAVSSSDKELLARGEIFMQEADFSPALEIYLKLSNNYPDSIDYKFKLGICYLYKGDEVSKSLPLLKFVQRESPITKDIDYYLGQAYLKNYRFDQATLAFNRYLSFKVDPILKKRTLHFIENCNNGKEIMSKPTKAVIKNMGPIVNSKFTEFGPVITADKSLLIFTYRGERSMGGRMNREYEPDPEGNFYEDVFFSRKIGDNWLDPEAIGNPINRPGNDAPIALTPDGHRLFIYLYSPDDRGDIYSSKLTGSDWSTPVKVLGSVNTPYWEGSCSISGDEKTLYFVSERPGGFGGRDIYSAKIQTDYTWGEIKNLGPNINTPYNEDSPFISPEGGTLYYSSEGHNSMGGYDIFISKIKNNVPQPSVNMGSPLNTPDDDKYYVVSADAQTGYLASKRSGGNGEADIYEVDQSTIENKPSLLLLTGIVYSDDKPVEAEIVVSFIDKNKGDLIQGDYISNATTGKYLINLEGGFNYSVKFILDGYPDQIIKVENENIKGFTESNKTIKFINK